MAAPRHEHLDDSVRGRALISDNASGHVLASTIELSFWGGVEPSTGEVIDRFHPLSTRLLRDTILVIPGGRGSCGGSAVILELIFNGLGPRALVFERREDIITFGVIVAEELFERSIPILVLGHEDFCKVLAWDGSIAHICGSTISRSTTPANDGEAQKGSTAHPERTNVTLSDSGHTLLAFTHGEAARVSMRILVRLADMLGAESFNDTTQAHADLA